MENFQRMGCFFTRALAMEKLNADISALVIKTPAPSRHHPMRLSVAQARPVKGDIPCNIANHLRLIGEALTCRAELVVFPELSITGYEPELARDLATSQDDPRFDVFQSTSDARGITIGIGCPTRHGDNLHISMILFQPGRPRCTYSKRYLYHLETPFFVPGDETGVLIGENGDIAPAICYEISVPEHAQAAAGGGARVYMAGVVETVDGVEKSIQKLAGIAGKYAMTVLMADCVGRTGGYESGGKSSIWNREGVLVGQLDAAQEGVLVFDTITREINHITA